MNKLTFADLELNRLYWFSDISDYSKCPTRVLVKVSNLMDGIRPGTLIVMLENVFTGEIFQAWTDYVEFEVVHPGWLENNIKHKKAELIRVARELEILEGL